MADLEYDDEGHGKVEYQVGKRIGEGQSVGVWRARRRWVAGSASLRRAPPAVSGRSERSRPQRGGPAQDLHATAFGGWSCDSLAISSAQARRISAWSVSNLCHTMLCHAAGYTI